MLLSANRTSDPYPEVFMRSAELAKLVGVTTRTLRYYHQLGIVAEPLREENGYRQYTVAHLVKVIRIKNLQATGLSLEDVARLLGTGGEVDFETTLKRLDEELKSSIDRLNEQRALVALALEVKLLPDMPGEVLKALGNMASRDVFMFDDSFIEDITLVAQILGESNNAAMQALLASVLNPKVREHAMRTQALFEALSDTSTSADIEAVIASMEELRVVLYEKDTALDAVATNEMQAFLPVYEQDALNAAQRRAAEGFSKHLPASSQERRQA
jgi:DNA-binding transcriptional MerR regulator